MTGKAATTTMAAERSGSKPAVAYIRVSSQEQEEEGWSIPAQRRLIDDYAARNGFSIIRVFEEARTAKGTKRRDFEEMAAFLRAAPSTVVLVEKTDRLYRHPKDWVTLDELGCQIHFIVENKILSPKSNSQDKFMHGVKVLMAKNYIDNLQEEIKKGLKEKAQQGVYPTHAPLGYLNVLGPDGKKKVIAPDPVRAPLIRRLFIEYDLGLCSHKTLTKFAWEIGLRTKKGHRVQRSGIQDILKNAAYCGTIRWGGEVYPGIHEPLVDAAMWQRVQDRMLGRCRNKAGFGNLDFAYRGLITCSCGLVMTGERKKERYVYYHCTGRRDGCLKPYVREEIITDQVSDFLKGIAMPGDILAWLQASILQSDQDRLDENRNSLLRLEGDIKKIKQRLERLYTDMADGALDPETYDSLRGRARQELCQLESQLAALNGPKGDNSDKTRSVLELAQTAHIRFKSANSDERRELLRLMCSNCIFDGQKLHLDLQNPFDLMLKVATTTPVVKDGQLAKTDQNQDWWR